MRSPPTSFLSSLRSLLTTPWVWAWLFLILATPAVLATAAMALPRSVWVLAVCVAAVSAAATIGIGWIVGRRGTMVDWLATAALGTGALILEYVMSWVVVDAGATTPNADNIVAAGVVMFTPPVFLLLASLTGIGFGVSARLRRVSSPDDTLRAQIGTPPRPDGA